MKLGRIVTIFFLGIIFANNWCFTQSEAGSACQQENEAELTVFVHGIMSVQPHLSFETLLKLFHDRVENSFYSCAVDEIRTDPFFQRNQAMQGLGLQPIDKKSRYAGDASCALVTILDKMYDLTCHQNPDNHYYYTYGWSGLLSPTIRLREACEFYSALAQEVKKFHERGIYPKIRVIGYSHGGNIVLGLAEGRRKKLADVSFVIDEVILLGVPIQPETDHFIHDPLFKKIYNFYSGADRIQTIDCFSFKRFGSRKYFTKRCGLVLPPKLVQIEIRLIRNTRFRKRKSRHRDKCYNFDDPRVIAGRSHGLRNCSPGHCELWFFGWTHAHYRANFALSPLPIIAILPFVLESIKEAECQFPSGQHIVADIRPQQETMILRSKYSKNNIVRTFLTKDELEDLKDTAREFSFKRVTYEDYDEHIEAAFERTRERLGRKR